ncbi:MAG: 5-dehydro-2-deoxygluconokinase, partial [Clostridiales bacterium]|nr:5-dehydro-2-deoxygluconokinase [Clostridiales bacterium]
MQFDPSRPLDIVLLGRIAIDFNPVDYFKTLAESETYKKYLGGSPANIAVGMARLGCNVGFFGKVSDDRFGDFVEDFFKTEGIDTRHITRTTKGESLGLTFTEILSSDESSILMYREGVADLMLSPQDIQESYIASAKMLLISGTALSASPSREAALKAVALAKKTNTPIVFDVDYRSYTWKSQDEITAYYSLVAEKSDIIMGSREEMDLTEGFLGLDGTDAASAKHWLGSGTSILVIKHGKKGSTAYTNEGAFSIKPFPVKALKSFGGGDGYASAFLSSLLKGLHIQDALEIGSAT